MEKIKQVRYSTGRGMYICKMLAERKESVEEAVKLYHDIMKVIVNG
jgi:translation elongation factor EF-Ts|nr:MAG TPA: Elongation factor [Caudoviricetes sp.]